MVVVVVLPGSSGIARAHDETVSTSDVTVAGADVEWKVDVGLAGLAKALPLPAPVDRMDDRLLANAAIPIGRFLANGLELVADGRSLTPSLGPLEPRYEQAPTGGRAVARVVQTLHYRAVAPIEALTAQVHFFDAITRLHRAVVRVSWDGALRQYVRLGPTTLAWSRATMQPSPWQVGGEFLRWGVHHIFVGYDHVAFLLALLLAVTTLRDLLVVVTAFTAAHTVTLLLSALGVVAVPAQLTEVLIAASIVYVAAENVMNGTRPPKRRALVTFGFGLVHGLGFATELRDRLAERTTSVVWPVVSFNLGVELGQLAIVALVFPVLAGVRRAGGERRTLARQRRIVTFGSLPILLLGLIWLVDRVSGG
jgi:hydrogenase/urease accessory protein HupE